MKHLGFLAAGCTLLLLGAADPPNKGGSLPGFADIRSGTSLLEVPGKDNKPLLRIVRAEFDQERKLIIWLVELQTDIGTEEKMTIDRAWFSLAAYGGPVAYFFDKEKVALYTRELKVAGKLYEGKKGDRIRMIIENVNGFPYAASMEIRKP